MAGRWIPAIIDIMIKPLRMVGQNYHSFQYKNQTFKFEYDDFRTFTEQRDAVQGHTFGREGIPISIFEDLDDSDVFIDLGAHFGVYSIVCAKLNPDLDVHAFEPTKYNIDILRKNLERNDIGNNVSSHQQVVSDKEGIITFYQDQNFVGSTRDTLNPPSDSDDEFQSIELDSVKISKFLHEHDYQNPFLKIDVEGAEDVIIGDLLNNFEGQIEGIIEIHSDRFEQGEEKVLSRLRSAGYELECLKEEPPTNRVYRFIATKSND